MYAIILSVLLLAQSNQVNLPYTWPEKYYRYVVNDKINDKDYFFIQKDPLEEVNLNPSNTVANNLSLNSFGAKGQYIPYSFVICANQNIDKISIEPSDLKNTNSNMIPKENIELRIGMRQLQTNPYSTSSEPFISTRFLPEFEPFSLCKECFREIYVLIHIPVNSVPGQYRGKIYIKPSNASSSEVEINLEVLPFSLKKPTNKKFGMYYHISDSLEQYRGKNSEHLVTSDGKNRVKLEIKQMIKYEGADIFILDSGIQYEKSNEEKIKISYAELETALSVLKDCGIKNTQVVLRTRFEKLGKLLGHNIVDWKPSVVLEGSGYENLASDKEFLLFAKKTIEGLKELQKRYPDFELILTHYSDEIDYPYGRAPLYIELTKAARQVPEFKMYVTFSLTYKPAKNERLETLRKELDPYVDIRGHAGTLFEWWLIGGGKVSDYFKELQNSKDYAWIYYNPSSPEKDAHYYRIVNGLNMWKTEAISAHVPWTYFYYRRGHYNIYDDSLENDEKARMTGFSFPSWKDNITPIPTKIFEGWREGIYDLQYFYTLREQIKRCQATTPQTEKIKQDASEWLSYIDSLFPSPSDLSADDKKWSGNQSVNSAPLTEAARKRISLSQLNSIRYRTADYISSLLDKCN